MADLRKIEVVYITTYVCNLFVGSWVQGSYDDCTAIGDELVIMIMMMLSMWWWCALAYLFYAWPIVVRRMGVGLGWVWVDEMDSRTTLVIVQWPYIHEVDRMTRCRDTEIFWQHDQTNPEDVPSTCSWRWRPEDSIAVDLDAENHRQLPNNTDQEADDFRLRWRHSCRRKATREHRLPPYVAEPACVPASENQKLEVHKS